MLVNFGLSMTDAETKPLSIRQKIGQLFFIGIQGTELNAEVKQLLEEIQPGGVCFFARNIREAAQTRKLNDDINKTLAVPPFLSLDQEGGLVDRLRRIVTPMPAASKLTDTDDVRRLANITAQLLRQLGFNMNFAPVVDVIDERRGAFQNGLYSRTFGHHKKQTAEFARVYLDELQSHDVIGCLKHFPGLGATEVDSHEELPTVKITDKQFSEVDLYPYREILKTSEVHAVMVAHAAFPESDLQESDKNGKLLPASLSINFIAKLLRGQLNFNNLIVTDDLEMGAVIKNYGIGEACQTAFAAGNDMLTICADPQNVRQGFAAIGQAFENGEISESRIDESLQRIASVKNLISAPVAFDENKINSLSRDIAELNSKLA